MTQRFDIKRLQRLSKQCRGDILHMTTLAQSGHPGGSISSLDIYLALYEFAHISAENFDKDNRDRIIISHGHTAPGIYSVLGRNKFFDIEKAIAYFRKAGSIFEGHVEPDVPGIEWATGNLGQGLSAGCGFALASQQKGIDNHVFVVMGDGEQQKGQNGEARRFATKYNLNITGIVDWNKLQISGSTDSVMRQDIPANYEADGWQVIEIDGHDFKQIFIALQRSKSNSRPTMILAKTTMGKGISFMENDETYHGKPLSEKQLEDALLELKLKNRLHHYKKVREEFKSTEHPDADVRYPKIQTSPALTYKKNKLVANRDAFGAAIKDVINHNKDVNFAVFDCDLAGSVRTTEIEEKTSGKFYEGGIQEHSTAVIAGSVSKENIISIFADFGVFGVDETYNQQRLNDINNTNLKLVTTHVGLNVGEDGKTHQCIDYIGVMRNLFGFKIIIPADANQTDKIIRYIISQPGNFYVPIGRSKTSIITDKQGKVFYDKDHKFEYGQPDQLRVGKSAAIVATGVMVEKALQVRNILEDDGEKISVWNLSCPSHISQNFIKQLAKYDIVFSYEDHNVNTGLGSILESHLMQAGLNIQVKKFGVRQYGVSGKTEEVYELQNLDPKSVAQSIKPILK